MQRDHIKEKLILAKLQARQAPEIYGEIYDIFVDRIWRYVYFKVSSKEDAEDLTAEVFLKGWDHLRDKYRCRKTRNLNAFLYTIARNKVIDFYRTRAKTAQREITLEQVAQLELVDTASNMSPVDQELLLKTIEKLNDEYREVIILRFIEELSVGEVAQIMSRSHGAVRILQHRALKVLKGLMSE